MDNVKEMANTGAEAAKETVEQVKARLAEGREAAKHYASKAKEAAGEYAQQAGEFAKQAKEAAEDRIVANPFWSMLVAMGIGLTLGAVLTSVLAVRVSGEK